MWSMLFGKGKVFFVNKKGGKVLKVGKYLPQHRGIPPRWEPKTTSFPLELVAPTGDKGTSFPLKKYK